MSMLMMSADAEPEEIIVITLTNTTMLAIYKKVINYTTVLSLST